MTSENRRTIFESRLARYNTIYMYKQFLAIQKKQLNKGKHYRSYDKQKWYKDS